MQDTSNQGISSQPSLRVAFVNLRSASSAYRQIPDPVPLDAGDAFQPIVMARRDAEEAFASALTKRGVPQGFAVKVAAWLTERLTPSGRSSNSVGRHASEGLYQVYPVPESQRGSCMSAGGNDERC